jgi:hypothetical protein
VPTFERLASFLKDFDSLTPSQKSAFLRAVVLFVADLRDGSTQDAITTQVDSSASAARRGAGAAAQARTAHR